MIHVDGYQGLGDAFYQRPAIKALCDRDGGCYLTTPWPFAYHDLPVCPVKPTTHLRTQRLYYESLPDETWHTVPKGTRTVRIWYGPDELKRGMTPCQAFAARLGAEPVPAPWSPPSALLDWDSFSEGRRVGLLRWPTVRREWDCPARNPDPAAFWAVIDAIAVSWVSVAHLDPPEESWYSPYPSGLAWRTFHDGELSPLHIAEIMLRAEVVVSGPCFLLPMAQALGVGDRAVFLFGGHAPPKVLLDPLLGPPPRVLAPEPFCDCYSNLHDCKRALNGNQVAALLEAMQ